MIADGVPSLFRLGTLERMWFSGIYFLVGGGGGYVIRTLARYGLSTGNKYISAVTVKIQVRKKSVASTKKDKKKCSSLFLFLFVHFFLVFFLAIFATFTAKVSKHFI